MSRKPKAGDKVYVKSSILPQFAGKPLTVKEVKFMYVEVLPKYARQTVEIMDDDIESYLEPEKLTNDERFQIIDRVVFKEMLDVEGARFHEIIFLNKLVIKYNNLDFWRSFDPGFQAKSLSWFLGGGKPQIYQFYNAFTLDFDKKVSVIGNVKLGEDIEIKKIKTLENWLI